jgi:probable rRNA maturation factor
LLKIDLINADNLVQFNVNKTLLNNFATIFIEQQKNILNYDTSLSLLICDNKKITELNQQYRNKNSATNILSFPAFSQEELLEKPHINQLYLGDLAISHEKIISEAKDQKKDKIIHFMHLLTHGCLHLLGYDHIEDNQAQIMENYEIDILAKLGYPNPYI